MASIQTSGEIQGLIDRLRGEEIAALQVFGINSLKSVTPLPDALVGESIQAVSAVDRLLSVATTGHEIVFDLQRTGKLVWLDNAQPYAMVASASRPTVRLLFASGRGLDLKEPAKTKRITVTISTRA